MALYVRDGPSSQRYLLLSANTLLLTPTLAVGWEPIDRFRVGPASSGACRPRLPELRLGGEQQQPPGRPRRQRPPRRGQSEVPLHPGRHRGRPLEPDDQIDVAGWYKVMATSTRRVTSSPRRAPAPSRSTPTRRTPIAVSRGATSPPARQDHGERAHPDGSEDRLPLPRAARRRRAGARARPDGAGHLRHRSRPHVGERQPVPEHQHHGAAEHAGQPSPAPSFRRTRACRTTSRTCSGRASAATTTCCPTSSPSAPARTSRPRRSPPQYQNIDFAGQQRMASPAADLPHPPGPAPKTKALEFSIGFGHTFIGTSTYTSQSTPNGGVHALSGTPCLGTTAHPRLRRHVPGWGRAVPQRVASESRDHHECVHANKSSAHRIVFDRAPPASSVPRIRFGAYTAAHESPP